jgi:hypothetical protein
MLLILNEAVAMPGIMNRLRREEYSARNGTIEALEGSCFQA